MLSAVTALMGIFLVSCSAKGGEDLTLYTVERGTFDGDTCKLHQGQQLVTVGQAYLAEGEPVRIVGGGV